MSDELSIFPSRSVSLFYLGAIASGVFLVWLVGATMGLEAGKNLAAVFSLAAALKLGWWAVRIW